jgi:hypothetical protein
MDTTDDIYKVCVFNTGQLEVNLNQMARERWKVIYSHFEPRGAGKSGQLKQWHIIMERLPEKRQ